MLSPGPGPTALPVPTLPPVPLPVPPLPLPTQPMLPLPPLPLPTALSVPTLPPVLAGAGAAADGVVAAAVAEALSARRTIGFATLRKMVHQDLPNLRAHAYQDLPKLRAALNEFNALPAHLPYRAKVAATDPDIPAAWRLCSCTSAAEPRRPTYGRRTGAVQAPVNRRPTASQPSTDRQPTVDRPPVSSRWAAGRPPVNHRSAAGQDSPSRGSAIRRSCSNCCRRASSDGSGPITFSAATKVSRIAPRSLRIIARNACAISAAPSS